MPKPKVMSLRFPSLGVVRRHAHERDYAAVAYPTPWSVNVRLEDSLTNRLRGGSWDAISAGSRPSEILYRDRLLTFTDNVITASRQHNHTLYDFDTDVSDTLRATYFQLANAGETGDDVVALVPHKDRFLLGFTATETWVQSGNPTTGELRRVSDEVGIIGADAWTKDHDTIYFLSSAGLYSVNADGSGLKALSEDKVPEDLTGVSDSACTLTYYHTDRGVYIHLSSGVSWFYDTEREGFWPFSSSSQSHLLVGPLRIGSPTQNGLIQTITGIMAAGGGTVAWRIVPGTTAEEAADNGKAAITAALASSDFDEYYQAEGSWEAGRSNTSWPRTRCAWCCVWLSSSEDWAFESIVMETVPFGRIR